MLKNYFIISLRNLYRNKVFSIINIGGLSLGLACAMLIILYTKDELSYDNFHVNGDKIYRVTNKWIQPDGSMLGKSGNTGLFQGPRFEAGIPEIKSFVRLAADNRDVKQGTEIKSQLIHLTDSNFFSVFTFPLLSGNPTTALLQPHSVVISEEVAKQHFGATDALNKTILFKNNDKFQPYVVTGVAKKCPQNSSIKFNILMPMQVSAEDEQRNENWHSFYLNTFVVLSPNAVISAVETKMRRIYETDAAEAIKMGVEKYNFKADVIHNLQPFTAMHLSEEYRADNGLTDASNPIYSYILSGVALFILLIACINFINLTVARSVKRAKEIGIRKVIGSDRKQLIVQFLGESFVLCTVAFAIAVLIVQLVLPIFNRLSNKALSLYYLFDVKLILGYVALFCLTGFLSGFYPALVISSYNPVQALYNRFISAGKNYLQKSLVVLQFALATLLVMATFVIYSQFNYLTKKELGYDDKNTVIVKKESLARKEATLFREELLRNRSIIAVANKNAGRWGTSVKVNGNTEVMVSVETIDESYLPLYRIPVVKGRNFSSNFPSDSTHSVLVNETFVKQAGWKDPIGKEVNFWYSDNGKYTVVGVVKDYHYASLSEKIGPQVFTINPGNAYGLTSIKIRPGTETESLKHIETAFTKIFPFNPYTYTFKDLENLKNYEAEAKWKQMILFGAILTIFISAIGLFGLTVMSAEKRTKEIGIRKVLGASVTAVVTTLSKDFIKLVTIALVIALPLSWLLTNKWLQNYPYRIEVKWEMFVAGAVLVLLIALITVSSQAIKAAIANPVKSLRTE